MEPGTPGFSEDHKHPMRFCMVTTYYPPYNLGGDGIFVHRLSNALAKRGHQVDVIHCVDAYRLATRREPVEAAENHPNVRVHGLRSPLGPISPLATQLTGRPLFKTASIKRILSRGFDVIHYHNVSLVGGAGILEYGQGIKLYTTHEYWLVCPTHTLFKFNREMCQDRQCFRCSLSYRRPPQWWRAFGLMDAAVKHVDAFLTPSLACLALHQNAGFQGPLFRLPEFAPSDEITVPDEARSDSDGSAIPYFLYVGRLERLKGLHTLIPIFRSHRAARLLIAGEGSQEANLRRLAEGTGNIEFLGSVSWPRLSNLYRDAVAVMVPSLCAETFSLVTVEAFRHRTPVMGRNLGGVGELILESGGGIAYETDEGLAAAMEQLLANPTLRRDLGTIGYNAYQLKWTTEAYLQAYLSIIRNISDRRAAALSSFRVLT